MNPLKYIVLTVILITQNLWGQDSISLIASQQIEGLKQARAQAIPPERLKDIHSEIFSEILAKQLGFDAYSYYLGKTWERLTKNQRILYLTDSTREILSIPKQFCHEEKCHELVAAYLPFVDVLLISDHAPDNEIKYWVYHELIHAFQYTYRFPLDVANVMAVVNDPSAELKLNRDDAVDFLKFFYESQANYYVLRMTRDKDWLKFGRSGITLFPGAVLKATLAAASFGQSLRIGNGFITEWLPIADEKNWRQGYLHISRGEQLEFKELIVLRNKWWMLNPSFNFDLKFHINYSLAIEEAYFGKTPFLLNDKGGDQKIFKIMHDDYYYKIIFINAIASGSCIDLLGKVTESAPLVGWLNVDAQQLLRCSVYTDFLKYRDEFQELYLQNKNKFFDKGGEGGPGPGLRISPNLYQPQLVIKPPRK